MAIKVTTTDGTTIEGTVEELKQLGITGGVEEESTEESDDKLVGKKIRVTKCIDGRASEGKVGYGKIGQGVVNTDAEGEVISESDKGIYVNITHNMDDDITSADEEDLANFYLRRGEYEIIDEFSHDFKVGDKVILNAGDSAGHFPLIGFLNGKEYIVEHLTPEHELDGVLCIVKEDGKRGYALPSQLRHVETESDIEVGDIVRVLTEHHTGSRNDPGDIGVVVRENDFGYYVEVANKTSVNGNHHVEENLEIIARKADRLDV